MPKRWRDYSLRERLQFASRPTAEQRRTVADGWHTHVLRNTVQVFLWMLTTLVIVDLWDGTFRPGRPLWWLFRLALAGVVTAGIAAYYRRK